MSTLDEYFNHMLHVFMFLFDAIVLGTYIYTYIHMILHTNIYIYVCVMFLIMYITYTSLTSYNNRKCRASKISQRSMLDDLKVLFF